MGHCQNLIGNYNKFMDISDISVINKTYGEIKTNCMVYYRFKKKTKQFESSHTFSNK